MTERAARYLSAPEAARYLAVSTRTFYDHVRKGVPAVRIGASVRFDVADLDEWAAKRKEAPAPREPVPTFTETRRPVRTALAHLKKLREQGKAK